jgi:hypothetical protein
MEIECMAAGIVVKAVLRENVAEELLGFLDF